MATLPATLSGEMAYHAMLRPSAQITTWRVFSCINKTEDFARLPITSLTFPFSLGLSGEAEFVVPFFGVLSMIWYFTIFYLFVKILCTPKLNFSSFSD